MHGQRLTGAAYSTVCATLASLVGFQLARTLFREQVGSAPLFDRIRMSVVVGIRGMPAYMNAPLGCRIVACTTPIPPPLHAQMVAQLEKRPLLRALERAVAKDGAKAVFTFRLSPLVPALPIGMSVCRAAFTRTHKHVHSCVWFLWRSLITHTDIHTDKTLTHPLKQTPHVCNKQAATTTSTG